MSETESHLPNGEAEREAPPERLWTLSERVVKRSDLEPMEPRLRIGVSACLLGDEVRFNGGHSRDGFLFRTLSRYVEWVRVCPEVEIGLGTPRESIRLVNRNDDLRLVAPKSGADHTDAMNEWSDRAVEDLAGLELHGFVFKKDSPSCGLHRVRIYDETTGQAQRSGRGLFADRLVASFPTLPVEEDGRLNDAGLRENFIERIFIHQRWLKHRHEDPGPGGLVRFHTAHKMSLLAHDTEIYGQLGRLVAGAEGADFKARSRDYETLLARSLAKVPSRGRHTNVLQHLTGFLKEALTTDEKAELGDMIDDYRGGLLPLIVPITLLKHHFRRHGAPDWVHHQVYLNPYPKELMLRNHV